jgi:hypothetical protein
MLRSSAKKMKTRAKMASPALRTSKSGLYTVDSDEEFPSSGPSRLRKDQTARRPKANVASIDSRSTLRRGHSQPKPSEAQSPRKQGIDKMPLLLDDSVVPGSNSSFQLGPAGDYVPRIYMNSIPWIVCMQWNVQHPANSKIPNSILERVRLVRALARRSCRRLPKKYF